MPRKKAGLEGGSGMGKMQNIPVDANILARSDSAERLNLRGILDSSQKGSIIVLGKGESKDSNSPAKKLMKKLIQAKKNMESYQPPKLPQVSVEQRR
jgi:hypothetical protein